MSTERNTVRVSKSNSRALKLTEMDLNRPTAGEGFVETRNHRTGGWLGDRRLRSRRFCWETSNVSDDEVAELEARFTDLVVFSSEEIHGSSICWKACLIN